MHSKVAIRLVQVGIGKDVAAIGLVVTTCGVILRSKDHSSRSCGHITLTTTINKKSIHLDTVKVEAVYLKKIATSGVHWTPVLSYLLPHHH